MTSSPRHHVHGVRTAADRRSGPGSRQKQAKRPPTWLASPVQRGIGVVVFAVLLAIGWEPGEGEIVHVAELFVEGPDEAALG